MKKIVLFFLIISFSFAVDVEIKTTLPTSLKEKVIYYWKNRAKKRFYKIYKLEMPYLRYLYDEDWYEDYFATANRFKKVIVKSKNCKDNICYLDLILVLPNKDKVFYKDKWIKVDNIWYHRFRDNPLPY